MPDDRTFGLPFSAVLSYQDLHTDSRAHPDCYPLGAGGCFHGVKVAGYSPSSSAGVMNEWNYALIPPTCLHRKKRCGTEWNLLIHVAGLCTVNTV